MRNVLLGAKNANRASMLKDGLGGQAHPPAFIAGCPDLSIERKTSASSDCVGSHPLHLSP
jgi:hypothetical protein